MASTYSPSLRLELIGDGDQSGIWGQTTNNNLGGLLEQAVSGVITITMTDANYTMSNFNGVVDEARNQVLIVTGTNTAVRNLVAPLVEKTYVVQNNTTGGYAIQIIGSSGLGVTIPNGIAAYVYCDGTNFYNAISGSVGNYTVNGNLAVTGTTALSGALTYGGVALSNSVTGTGSMVLSAGPTFTGAPAAPTATAGTNTTQLATTAFVTTALSGLGTMSTQNANNVSITGGTITGITDLTVADGGTGASTFTANSIVLGNGTSSLAGNMVAPSTSGNLLVSNGTTWTSATLASSGVKLGLGITGEVWNNLTGSRSANTTYTNSRAYPIMVNIQLHSGSSGTNPSYLYVNGSAVANVQGGGWTGGMDAVCSAIVPPGATYSTNSSAAGSSWWELY
jgi:hypothetical protein